MMFAIKGDNVTFVYTGEIQQREVVADGRWDIEVPVEVDWCTVTPEGGSRNGIINIKVSGNPNASQRHVDLNIFFNGKTQTYTITQEGNPGTGPYVDGEVRVYEKNRLRNPVNLIFIGDGFIEEDFDHEGAFDQAVAEGVEALFQVEPYKSYREYFNIYKIAAFSQQRGATYADMRVVRNTAFGTTYNGGSAMDTDEEKVFSRVRQVLDIDLDQSVIFLIVNDERYGGTTIMYSTGRSVAICPLNRIAVLPGGYGNILVHEGGGHGFGRLADEYTNRNATSPDASVVAELEQWSGFGYYDNVDLTSDLSQIKWKDFIGLSGYEAVGAYEGGYGYEFGIWRPEVISCMDDNRPYFNAPSRMSIVKRILSIAGETFTMENFMAKDVVRTAPQIGYTQMETITLPKLAPPVMVDNR